jgi:hypothetical protein
MVAPLPDSRQFLVLRPRSELEEAAAIDLVQVDEADIRHLGEPGFDLLVTHAWLVGQHGRTNVSRLAAHPAAVVGMGDRQNEE